MICPDCCTECPTTTVDFEDGTANATGLTPDTISAPWSIVNVTGGKVLQLDSMAANEFGWIVPTTDDGTPTSFSVSANVVGDSWTGATGGAGGVFLDGEGWSASFGCEAGSLVLTVTDGVDTWTRSLVVDVDAVRRLTLWVTSSCDGRAVFAGQTDYFFEEERLSIAVNFSIEPDGLPASVRMGVYGPGDADTGSGGGDPPFPDCCPDDTSCYSGFTATGSLVNPEPPCDPNNCAGRVEALSLTTGSISCGGSPLVISGWTDSDPYLIGDFPASTHPISGSDSFFGDRLLIYCDGTSVKWARLDSGNCFIEGGSFTTFACDPFGGTIDGWASETSGCCDGFGAQAWRITVAGTPTTCSDADPRRFDDVRMRACGGATPPECPPPGTVRSACSELNDVNPPEVAITAAVYRIVAPIGSDFQSGTTYAWFRGGINPHFDPACMIGCESQGGTLVGFYCSGCGAFSGGCPCGYAVFERIEVPDGSSCAQPYTFDVTSTPSYGGRIEWDDDTDEWVLWMSATLADRFEYRIARALTTDTTFMTTLTLTNVSDPLDEITLTPVNPWTE